MLIHIIATAGNSHMAGRDAALAGDAFNEKVYQYGSSNTITQVTDTRLDNPLDTSNGEDGQFSPSLEFSNQYLANNPHVDRLIFVPYAQGGTGFSDGVWSPDVADHPNNLTTICERINTVKSLIEADGDIAVVVAFMFHNARPDYDSNTPDAHRSDIDGLISYVRANVKSDLPVVIGGGMTAQQLATYATDDTRYTANLVGVGQRNLYAAGYDVINPQYGITEGLPIVPFDGTHANRAGEITKGRLQYRALVRAQQNTRLAFPFDSDSFYSFIDFRSGTALDQSGNGNGLAEVGTPLIRYDATNEQLVFDRPAGTDRFWQAGFALPESYTIHVMYKPDSLSDSQGLAYTSDVPEANQFKLGLLSSGTALRAGHNGASDDVSVTSTDYLAVGQWSLITLTYDASTTTMTLYVDGVQAAQNAAVANHAATAGFYVGAMSTGATPNEMLGDMAFVAISDSALTSTQVASFSSSADLIKSPVPQPASVIDNYITPDSYTPMPTRTVWNFDHTAVASWDSDVTVTTEAELTTAIRDAMVLGSGYHRITSTIVAVSGQYIGYHLDDLPPDDCYILVEAATETIFENQVRVNGHSNVKWVNCRFEGGQSSGNKCFTSLRSGTKFAFQYCDFGHDFGGYTDDSLYPESGITGVYSVAAHDCRFGKIGTAMSMAGGFMDARRNLVYDYIDDGFFITTQGRYDNSSYAYVMGNVILNAVDNVAYDHLHPDFLQTGHADDMVYDNYKLEVYDNIYIGDTVASSPTQGIYVAKDIGNAGRIVLNAKNNVMLVTANHGIAVCDKSSKVQSNIISHAPTGARTPTTGEYPALLQDHGLWLRNQVYGSAGDPVLDGVIYGEFIDGDSWGDTPTRNTEASHLVALGSANALDTVFPNLAGLTYDVDQIVIPSYAGALTIPAVRSYIGTQYEPAAGWSSIGMKDPSSASYAVVGTESAEPTPENQGPTANAGQSQTVIVGTRVQLDATGSFDTDGTIESYAWTKLSGPVATFEDATVAQPYVTLNSTGNYTFEVVVTDNDGASNSAQVSITVKAVNQVPITGTILTNLTRSLLKPLLR